MTTLQTKDHFPYNRMKAGIFSSITAIRPQLKISLKEILNCELYLHVQTHHCLSRLCQSHHPHPMKESKKKQNVKKSKKNIGINLKLLV